MEVKSDGVLYPEFAPGELLTSQKLNDLVRYFSFEELDTRVFLIGCGIFFGLEVEYDSTFGTITVKAGAGLSSNGELFAIETDVVFIMARTGKITIGGNVIEAQILISKEIAIKESAGNIKINEDSMILLQIQKDSTPNNDCLQRYDNVGKTVRSQIHVCVISTTDMETEKNKWPKNEVIRAMKEVLTPFIHRFGYQNKKLPEEQQIISFDDFTNWKK